MKRTPILLMVLALVPLFFTACEDPVIEASFEDLEEFTMYDYMVENEETYSSFLSILESGGLDRTLGAYNPNGEEYTLFLPTNEAIDHFINNSDIYDSLQELMEDRTYASAISKFHVINRAFKTDEFPFGAFSEPTLSNNYLTVQVVVETDTAYYLINNRAPVTHANIEVSNGFIHEVGEMLLPITFTTYEWLETNQDYSIFASAVDATGLEDIFSLIANDSMVNSNAVTLFLEADSIFNKHGIHSFEDLAGHLSPENDNYTDPLNPLHTFVAYHGIEGNFFLDDFEGEATNYSTFADVPININGLGIDIAINKGKVIYDTIISGLDTTIIDYITFYYDDSNQLTKSGAIHFIDHMLIMHKPSRAIRTFQFLEEPLFREYGEIPGDYLIEDTASLFRLKWQGADLTYHKGDPSEQAWNDDYIRLEGDFTVTYRIPKLVQGRYRAYLRANARGQQNAMIQMTIDGAKVGGLIDLSAIAEGSSPYAEIELGTVDFLKYAEHNVHITTLIPGRFIWDYIRFEPF
jgi:uncharacterized surface protein with fasciclin (FAS1) repeats